MNTKPMNLTPGIIERFWRFIVKNETTGCWEWQKALVQGYGVISIKGRRLLYAHRVSAQIHHINCVGLVIDHLCRNTKCCNPNHIWAITQSMNAAKRDKQLAYTK